MLLWTQGENQQLQQSPHPTRLCSQEFSDSQEALRDVRQEKEVRNALSAKMLRIQPAGTGQVHYAWEECYGLNSNNGMAGTLANLLPLPCSYPTAAPRAI